MDASEQPRGLKEDGICRTYQSECETGNVTGCRFSPRYAHDRRSFFTDEDGRPYDYTNQRMTWTSVLGRFTGDISHWKRYRGGKRGKLWLDLDGGMQYEPLVDIMGNIGLAGWVHDQWIFFVSDTHCKESDWRCVSQLYITPALRADAKATTPSERVQSRTSAMRMVTNEKLHYVRSPVVSTGSGPTRVVFTVGPDIKYLTIDRDGTASTVQTLHIDYVSPRQQRRRTFLPAVDASDLALSPDASQLASLSRGRPFIQSAREKGSPIQYGVPHGVRYTHVDFLPSGHLLAVSDEHGESGLEVFRTKGVRVLISEHLAGARHATALGRVEEMVASPVDQMVALVNHQYTLIVLDLTSGHIMCTLQSTAHPGIGDIAWSPDGRWIAFSFTVKEDRKSVV